ncbi:copper homeostasis protein CutC [Gemmobacter caeruleus]|uniref:copper homeostasis protein CutC n=1 Tax=Gemmobacter caeruleus TaxID=2595004 RepID=UPI001EF140EA|nr:copper homeostasis protein CutC [Gemmobacter caeruleus]
MLIEVCVDTAAGLAEAVAGGAGRIELCSALALGGLTPSAGLMRAAVAHHLPIRAMMRPRDGDFVWSAAERDAILHDIATARAAGLEGVVLGASHPDGRLDAAALSEMAAAAQGMGRTLHRCFDLVPDWQAALETAIALGFDHILTSGQALRAEDGFDRLVALRAQAAGRIVILPGSGITPANAARFAAAGFAELHASCAAEMPADPRVTAFGFAPPCPRQTRADRVAALLAAAQAPR